MIHTHGQKIALVAGSLAMLAAIVLAAVGLPSTSAQTGSVVSMHPSKTNLNAGETVDIEISATSLTNIAAYDIMIQYNKSVLEFQQMTNSDFLASTGRNVSCPPPVLLDDDAANEHKVQDGCASTNLTPDGPSGDGALATFTFKAVADGTSDLVFRKIEFANPNGDSAATIDSVKETAIGVGAGSSSDNSGGGGGSGGSSATPTPPPTPLPNAARLTPTAVAGAQSPDTLTLDPSNSGGAAPAESSGGGSSGSGSANSGTVQGASSSTGDPNFPHAGYGPQHEGRSHPSPFAIAGLFVGGLVLAGFGVVSRVKQQS